MAESPNIFVTQISNIQGEQLKQDLLAKGFVLASPPPPYTVFSAKKTGLSCTLYLSGKLVVQGKNIKEFMEFYLEPEVLQSFTFTNPEANVNVNMKPHIGIDESGKGDLFGPLCTAGVHATTEQIEALLKLGVCDSKKLNDVAIAKLAPQIQKICTYHIVKIMPKRYNELYEQFRNLNHLLAWTHATAIEALVLQTHCLDVMVDQFAAEHVVETALKRKLLSVNLTQQHRAEADVVVAAASILARYTFIVGINELSQEFGVTLPKGASAQTIVAARAIVYKHGREALPLVSKTHFKSLDGV